MRSRGSAALRFRWQPWVVVGVALGRTLLVFFVFMPKGTPKGKHKDKGDEEPPRLRPVKPERPSDEASEARWAAFAEEMRAYSIELSEFASETQRVRPSSSGSSARKEIRLESYDGAYENLARWLSQLRAAARLRGWEAQLEPDWDEPPEPAPEVQLELESAMALCFESTALQSYQSAVEAHARLRKQDPRCHFRAAFVLSFVAAAVRLRFRGSLYRQATDLLDPARRCAAGDAPSVRAHLDLHTAAVRDLESAAMADPGPGSVPEKVYTAIKVGLQVHTCTALAPQLNAEFGNKPTDPTQPAVVADRAVQLAGSLPQSAPPVAVAASACCGMRPCGNPGCPSLHPDSAFAGAAAGGRGFSGCWCCMWCRSGSCWAQRSYLRWALSDVRCSSCVWCCSDRARQGHIHGP